MAHGALIETWRDARLPAAAAATAFYAWRPGVLGLTAFIAGLARLPARRCAWCSAW